MIEPCAQCSSTRSLATNQVTVWKDRTQYRSTQHFCLGWQAQVWNSLPETWNSPFSITKNTFPWGWWEKKYMLTIKEKRRQCLRRKLDDTTANSGLMSLVSVSEFVFVLNLNCDYDLTFQDTSTACNWCGSKPHWQQVHWLFFRELWHSEVQTAFRPLQNSGRQAGEESRKAWWERGAILPVTVCNSLWARGDVCESARKMLSRLSSWNRQASR